MIWFCKNVLLLTFFFYLGLSLVRIYGDEITNIIIMCLSKYASVTVGVSAGIPILIYGLAYQEQRKGKKSKDLEERMQNLKEELNNEEKSLEDVKKEIINLKNLAFCIITRILENQGEQVNLELTDLQPEIEKIREKLQSVESEITECEKRNDIDRKGELLKEKQRLLNELWRPERKKEQLERLQLNTKKLLQDVGPEDLIKMTIEMKEMLENDIQQLKKQLEEKKKEWEVKQQSCCRIC
ncbi:chromosome partition protein Smc [Lates calcarifer]|uniref:Chromosome partition protein Smc n=1 Tax=Lates calcarifer TaxID=8187 RepID=A0AAJ8B196_LATCA|nr:chromosome partition protein Smc [Lates calcarifer]